MEDGFGQNGNRWNCGAVMVLSSDLSPPPSSFGVDLTRLSEPRFFLLLIVPAGVESPSSFGVLAVVCRLLRCLRKTYLLKARLIDRSVASGYSLQLSQFCAPFFRTAHT